MQKFCNSWGVKRRIDIRLMKVEEIGEFYSQYLELSTKDRNRKEKSLMDRIKDQKTKSEITDWVLAVINKDDRLIGKMEVYDMGDKKAFLTVDIPNKIWIIKYGAEAIDQFIKICTEQNLFSEIEVEARNDVCDFYRKQHNIKQYVIKIA